MKTFVGLFILGLVTAIFFQNCSASHSGNRSDSLNSLENCSQNILPVFEGSFYSFFKTQSCSSCHDIGKQASQAPFGQANLARAFTVFNTVGPSKVINKIKNGHQGYSYTQLKSSLDSANAQWEQGIQDCQSDQGQALTWFNSSQALVKSSQAVTFDLSEINRAFPVGTLLRFTVSVSPSGSGQYESYVISDLQIQSSIPFFLGSVVIRVDNEQAGTTFTRLNKSISASSSFQSLSQSASVHYPSSGKVSNSHLWSISIQLN